MCEKIRISDLKSIAKSLCTRFKDRIEQRYNQNQSFEFSQKKRKVGSIGRDRILMQPVL